MTVSIVEERATVTIDGDAVTVATVGIQGPGAGGAILRLDDVMSAALQQVRDNAGSYSPLWLSTAGARFTAPLDLTDELTISSSAGTAGQLLTSQGAGLAPAWADPAPQTGHLTLGVALDATLRQVLDVDSTGSPLYLSTTGVKVTSALALGSAGDLGLARYNDGVRSWAAVSDGTTPGLGHLYADKVAFGNALTPFVFEARDSNFCVLNLLSSIGNTNGTGGLMLKYIITSAGYVSTQLMTATTAVSTPTIGSLANDQTIDIASTRLWTVAGNAVEMAQTTFSASSGTQAAVAILPTYNASGTASGIDLYLNRTETAVGSGSQFLAWFGVGGVEKFSVTNAGAVSAANRLVAPILQDPAAAVWIYAGEIGLASTWSIGWTAVGNGYSAKDLVLDRHDSGTAIYLDVSTGGGIRVPAGTAANPSVSFAGNSGLYDSSSGRVAVSCSGNLRWEFAAGEFGSFTTGHPILARETASNTNPTVIPYFQAGVYTTGLGGTATDLSLIVSSTEIARCLRDAGSNPVLRAMSVLSMLERSSDPSKPAEGEAILWMSDGTGLGDDGDVIIASTAGGATNYSVLFDHSAGTTWA